MDGNEAPIPLQVLLSRKRKRRQPHEEKETVQLSIDEQIAMLEKEIDEQSGGSDDGDEGSDSDGSDGSSNSDGGSNNGDGSSDDCSTGQQREIPALPVHLLPAPMSKKKKQRIHPPPKASKAGAGTRTQVKELQATYEAHSHRSMYCRVCKVEAPTKEALEAHWASDSHKELANIEMKASFCHLCKKQFTSPLQLKEHVKGKAHKERVKGTASKNDMCRDFKKYKRCRFGSNCKFRHE